MTLGPSFAAISPFLKYIIAYSDNNETLSTINAKIQIESKSMQIV